MHRDLKFAPNNSFYYTTYGYVILGWILEKISGISYENYMQKNIWDIAGMENTGIEKFQKKYTNKSKLYTLSENKIKKAKKNNLSNRAPGGGMYTTINDMLKFGDAILHHTLISKKSLDLMTKSHYVSTEKDENDYGFGWYLYGPKSNKKALIGHSGEQEGAANQFALIPEKNIVLVILANTSGTYDDIADCAWQLIKLTRTTIE